MKKVVLVLALMAMAFSPVMVSQADAATVKHHRQSLKHHQKQLRGHGGKRLSRKHNHKAG